MRLAPDVVLLWQWDLDDPGISDPAVLSAEERSRADRFVVAHGGRRFAAGRAALRQTLAALRGVAAAALVFSTGPNGKPFLPGGPHFNLSHTGAVALFAVATFPVGVDVEAVRTVEPGVANSVFTPGELTYLAGLPSPERRAAFFRGWTRKEAVIKANGGSIAELQAIAVLPDARLAGWQVTDLTMMPGYAASVAAQRRGWTVTRQGQESGAI